MVKERKNYHQKGNRQKHFQKNNKNNQQKSHNPHTRKLDGNRQPFLPKVTLREDQVGITEYISSLPGFTGILKSRYSDFQVNEIDKSGKVLQLTDLTIPQPKKDPLTETELAKAKNDMADIITEDIWQQIATMAATKNSNETDSDKIEIEVTSLDKEARTKIHKVIKQLYEGKLVSRTATDEKAAEKDAPNDENTVERKFIRIGKLKGGERNRVQWSFPGEYVHFIVHKENLDTSEAAVAIASQLKLRPSQVNYCGTKDKRGKTTQKFCVKRRYPMEIVDAVRKSLRNVHIGNFEFSNDVLRLGDLSGNRFRIGLRHCRGDRTQIENALNALRERGFINYFGLQRFGNCASIPTYEVGVALLKSDYKLASELILKPRDNEPQFLQTIRTTWWKNRNSAEAAAMFHAHNKSIEKKVLDGLAQYGENDYAAALRKIPRNMLLLYPHAYQSFMFNRIASRRLKEFGFELIPGDLVYRDPNELDDTIIEYDNVENALEAEDIIQHDASQAQNENNLTNGESAFKRKVKSLTAEEIASGNYNLFDVVLPLPGYDITYPHNVVGGWYEDLLQADGLSSEKLRHNVKTFAMAGAYRKLLIQPTDLKWNFRTYTNADSTLISSDWEQLKGISVTPEPTTDAGAATLTALLLDFSLPTSAYATMLLRELLKSDTSAAHQAQMEKSEMLMVTAGTDAATELANNTSDNIEEVSKNITVSEIETNEKPADKKRAVCQLAIEDDDAPTANKKRKEEEEKNL